VAEQLNLKGRLTLDKTGFDEGLSASQKQVEHWSHHAAKKFAAAFAIHAIVEFIKEIVAAGKEIDDLANKLNVTSQQAQKIRMEELLGGRVGTGVLTMPDFSLETIRLIPRAITQAKEAVKSFGGVLLSINPILGAWLGLLTKTGLVKGGSPIAKPEDINSVLDEQASELDEINKLNREAQDITEKSRLSQLTKEEKLNELLREREKILERLFLTPLEPGDEMDPVQKAAAAKRLAEVNAGIVEAGTDAKKTGSTLPSGGSGGLAGVFMGEAAGAGIGTKISQTNAILRSVYQQLSTRGIRIDPEGL
jgi:hypothetical protein